VAVVLITLITMLTASTMEIPIPIEIIIPRETMPLIASPIVIMEGVTTTNHSKKTFD
jgi:hypothetical protein